MISFSTNMEHNADVLDRNIRRLADRKRKANLLFSEDESREIANIYQHVREAMQLAVSAFMSDDEERAEQLIADKRTFRTRNKPPIIVISSGCAMATRHPSTHRPFTWICCGTSREYIPT